MDNTCPSNMPSDDVAGNVPQTRSAVRSCATCVLGARAVITAMMVVAGCLTPANDAFSGEAAGATVRTYPAPQGAPISSDYVVTVNGRPVDVYATPTRYRHRDNKLVVMGKEEMDAEPNAGDPCYYGYFDFAGEVNVEVTATWCEAVRGASIHPLAYRITPTVSRQRVSFKLDRPRKLTVMLNDDPHTRPLHLFANGLEADAVAASDAGVRYYGPGYHKQATVDLQDGETLYLAGGACLEGRILVTGKHDVKIRGRGVLLGATAGITIKSSSNVLIQGIICNRRKESIQNWAYASSNITVRDYKIISGNIWSTDGFDPCNSQDVLIEDCFIRSGDDCIAIKGLSGRSGSWHDSGANPQDHPPVERVCVRQCVFWSDNNCCMTIGTETIARRFHDIRFEDCDVLYQHHRGEAGAIGLRVRWSTDVGMLRFENIRVERCTGLFSWWFPETIFGKKAGNHTRPGGVSDVVARNITVLEAGCTSRIWGWNAEQRIEDVTFENLVIGGKHIRRPEDGDMDVNEHTRRIVFK